MAVDKLGDRIDIHSGGIDLSFPHHDNEIARESSGPVSQPKFDTRRGILTP